MDPVTHGIIGLGISALSGQDISFSNPIVLGSVIGAMSPDIDIIVKYWGDYAYLKHHRGISHSIVGLGVISAVISLGLSMMFKDYTFFSIFIWTFLGSLSHTVFDMLNSYGARFLLPFSKKKIAFSLLMLVDPFIPILSLSLVFINVDRYIKGVVALTVFSLYIVKRYYLRSRAEKILKENYQDKYIINRINILPSLFNPFKWDFIIETENHNIVGEVNSISKKVNIRKELKKEKHSFIEKFYQTELGRYFSEFSPIRHINVIEQGERIILKAIDLRYYIKNNFMHHATVIFCYEKKKLQTFFHPYSLKNNILVEEKEIA
ncbi:metal-dependent hydrolase [Thermohalobacter berrensis]|uniref:Hydrolase n=1 Tax=Thermohalobacter berrensis TaxID=99594 RepID=A0A419T6V5_9FIRM|nr:metal-dependent hydrolase [Thermohalobacter berrensis]RKD33166.1 hydrolase [Thermohalobacter berrensis]